MFLLCSVLKCLSEENFDHQRKQVPRVSGGTRCCKVSCDSGCWRSNRSRIRAACWVEGVHLVPPRGGDDHSIHLILVQVLGLLASSPRPSSLASPGQHSTSPLALDKPLRRCRSERRSQSLGEREAVLSRSVTERRGVFARSRNPSTQDVPDLRSPLQRFQAKFARAASLEVPDVVAEPTKFTIPEIKLDVPDEESPQLRESRLY